MNTCAAAFAAAALTASIAAACVFPARPAMLHRPALAEPAAAGYYRTEPAPPVEAGLREAIVRWFPPGVDVDLMVRIADCESGLDPAAVSRTNDYGVFQVNARVWAAALAEDGIAARMTDLLDLDTGVRAAAYVSRNQPGHDGLAAWWGGPEYGGWGTGPGGNGCWHP